MKRLMYILWSKFLTFFGEIKVFRFPGWLVYDPDDFQVTGDKVLELMDLLEPGDIVLRGYNHYLDGKFIPDKQGFSHGAIYIGDNKLVHAVAEGVSETSIIEYCQCDRIAAFRPKRGARKAVKRAKSYLNDHVPYDYGFSKGVSALYCFELCGECYTELNVEKMTVKKLFGLLKREDVYLAESFFKSKDMKCIFNYNPKLNIDYTLD